MNNTSDFTGSTMNKRTRRIFSLTNISDDVENTMNDSNIGTVQCICYCSSLISMVRVFVITLFGMRRFEKISISTILFLWFLRNYFELCTLIWHHRCHSCCCYCLFVLDCYHFLSRTRKNIIHRVSERTIRVLVFSSLFLFFSFLFLFSLLTERTKEKEETKYNK
jgi:hypothetical protein